MRERIEIVTLGDAGQLLDQGGNIEQPPALAGERFGQFPMS
jgi:hypothetical protein